jgi:hypothetical protein
MLVADPCIMIVCKVESLNNAVLLSASRLRIWLD